MGKQSKRQRSSKKSQQAEQRPAPALRPPEEETKDNLKFQDPFYDEFEEYDPNEEEEAPMEDKEEEHVQVASWNPLTGSPLEKGEALEMDASAYKMYHAFTNEWPSLTFDFVRDDLGESRTRFPHSFLAVVGTQAPTAGKNLVTLVKLSDLGRTNVETDDDILGEELDAEKSDDESDSDDDEDVDLDPVLEHVSVAHYGGVNRLRTMPQRSDIVASWSDQGQVNIYDVSSWTERFSGHHGATGGSSSRVEKPVFTYKGHNGVEGYAMDWSKINTGYLATGDCSGNIHLWQPEAESLKETASPVFHATPSYESETSVEDLQWSPTESTVLAAASCEGYVRIYDTRAPHRAMLTHQIHKTSKADVNVLSWNHLVANLMATGGDDGMLSVWDLRNNFKEPLARFTSHKTPITSVEWHPTDESMLAVSDDVGAYVYDLSVEEDDNAGGKRDESDIPPQLLFVHCGSQQFKEVHWHPQIRSCLMTTALTGFSVFIPSNL